MVREQEEATIRELLRTHPKGLTIEEVSKKLALNRTTAAKYLNAFVLIGQAEMRMLGSAKLFSLTQRVPLTNLLSLSSDLILILDQDLFIQEANTPFLGFFHLRKDEVRGTRLDQSSLAPHFTDPELTGIVRALDGEGNVREIRFDLIDDSRYFRMKCIPLTFESGARAVGIILEDITEMKTYQQNLEKAVQERTTELRESQRMLATLMGNLPGMAYRCRNDPAWTMEFVSEGCADLTGYLSSDLIGNRSLAYTDLIHPQDRQQIWDEVQEALREKTSFQIMYRINTSTGAERWVWEQGLGVYSPDGDVVAIEGFVTDVTDRKTAEEIIRKANKQVALLTSITRHDIINQVNSLQGYILMIQKSATSERDTRLLEKIDTIAATILRQIIFTRDYQNVGAEPPCWIHVTRTLLGLLDTLDRGDTAISIETGELEIYADPLIEKVFFNLIDNALRHGGRVRNIRFFCEQEGRVLLIICEDDGIGIAAEEKEMIFSRGFGKNTGYGLFLIREILAITGFTISESGTPGSGARFVIRITEPSYRNNG